MKLTPEEKAITFRIAAYSGLALALFMALLMIFATEEQWRVNGPIYMLMGVLGYFSLVFIGMVAFLRMEVKGPGGRTRRVTMWEVLGYALLGGIMSKLLPYVESRVGGSEPMLTIVAVAVLVCIAILLFLQNRKGKVLKG
jgi:hypothetical protein